MTAPATYVETRDVPVPSLVHYPGNANKGDIDEIRASYRRSGQYRALVVREQDDGQLVVLAGNNTLVALRGEGCRVVRCEIHRMDDQAARRINLADNRIARLAVPDEDLILDALSHLDEDYEGTGYTDTWVDERLAGWVGPPRNDDHETTATLPTGRGPGEVPAGDDDHAAAELAAAATALLGDHDTPAVKARRVVECPSCSERIEV